MTPAVKLPVDRFSVDQLLLGVSETVDPKRLDLADYEEFLRQVTQGRPYQREAIETAIRFLAGGRYASTVELAQESYAATPDLQRWYLTAQKLIERLPFPGILACTLDLATATGKSFVYHAIARIMLNEGLIDRVLLLCPSLTIEAGLKEKFNDLVGQGDLADLLPVRKDAIVYPSVVDAGSTVKAEQICIENIHATFERTGSSIEDSFAGRGERTLVISDEAHHLYSSATGFNKWKEFIEDERFDFRYHLGGSGTCYVSNDYFADVVYRYSIRDAINDGWIKEVFYLAKDSSATDSERFQKLQAKHEENRKAYQPLKPLTIAVAQNIKQAEALAANLIEFLTERLKGGRAEAKSKVLIVTSSPDHVRNLVKLKAVDASDSPVEWIVSVAMLSEGWDVQNVFQIYPHEKRAFNSKLLISQVLGRGLRRPPGLPGQGTVYVFNHEKWGPEIGELVAEVLDVETTIAQRPTDKRPAHHFELHTVDYEQVPTGVKAKEVEKPGKITKIDLRPQRDHDEHTEFRSATDATRTAVLTTRVVEKRYPLAEVVKDVRARLLEHDKQTGGDLAKQYPKATVEKLVRDGLKRLKLSGEEVTQENRQLILSAFGSRRQKRTRPGAKLEREPTDLRTISTADMRPVTARISALTSNLGLYYDAESAGLGTDDDGAALKKARGITVPTNMVRVPNSYLLRSPVNVVLTSHAPELRFVERLIEDANAKALRSWVKAPDTGFYEIEYSFKKTPESKRQHGTFNPDFLLSVEGNDLVVVVETKSDGDVNAINAGKLAAAQQHFVAVNERLGSDGSERRYDFHFLSPGDYDSFFDALRADELEDYVSSLQGALSQLIS